jgi:hypothetical protein
MKGDYPRFAHDLSREELIEHFHIPPNLVVELIQCH